MSVEKNCEILYFVWLQMCINNGFLAFKKKINAEGFHIKLLNDSGGRCILEKGDVVQWLNFVDRFSNSFSHTQRISTFVRDYGDTKSAWSKFGTESKHLILSNLFPYIPKDLADSTVSSAEAEALRISQKVRLGVGIDKRTVNSVL